MVPPSITPVLTADDQSRKPLFATDRSSRPLRRAGRGCAADRRQGHDLRRTRCGDRTARVMAARTGGRRSEEHPSELQSLMRTSYAVFCLKKKKNLNNHTRYTS